MKSKTLLITILSYFFFYSCSNYEININENCILEEDLGVTESNSVLSFNNMNLEWRGSFSDKKVKIQFVLNAGYHGEQASYIFEFNKNNECIEINKAYILYHDGLYPELPPRSVRKIRIDSIKIQDWKEDKLITGEVAFTITGSQPPFIKHIKKFWVNMDNNDYYEEPTVPRFTFDCLENQLPKMIDINNDGIDDFVFEFTENIQDQIEPTTINYKIVLNPINQNNYVLRPNIGFGFPFINGYGSSINTSIVSELNSRYIAYFKEYPHNYFEFNRWVTYVFNNGISFHFDNQFYVFIKIKQNNLDYYGWINIKVSIENCSLQVLETYLNPNPNEHVVIP